MSLSKLSLGKIPVHVQRKAGGDIFNFSTPILGLKTSDLDEQPILLGSATFVQFGEDKGLLTAQHVIRKSEYDKCENIGLVISSGEHRFTIPRAYFQDQTTIPISEEYGPDIAFIKIPDIHISRIAAQKSFWQMEVNHRKIPKMHVTKNYGIWMIFGCPSVYQKTEPSKSSFKHTFVPGGLMAMSAKAISLSRKTYDYFDVPVLYEDDNDLPNTFGGVSGGGLWFVPLSESASGPKTIQVHHPILVGVAFYETGVEDNRRVIRCHGIKSIYVNMQKIVKNM